MKKLWTVLAFILISVPTWALEPLPQTWQKQQGYENLPNAVVLIGNLTPSERLQDMRNMEPAIRNLVSAGLIVDVVPEARAEDLRAALRDPQNVVTIWVGHGSPEGYIADSLDRILPSFYLSDIESMTRVFVAATCYGSQVCRHYLSQSPGFQRTQLLGYDTPTTGNELWTYLKSPEFKAVFQQSLNVQTSTPAYPTRYPHHGTLRSSGKLSPMAQGCKRAFRKLLIRRSDVN